MNEIHLVKNLTMPYSELLRVLEDRALKQGTGCVVSDMRFENCYFTDCPEKALTFIPHSSFVADILRAYHAKFKGNPFTYGAMLIGRPMKFLLCNVHFGGCTFAAKK